MCSAFENCAGNRVYASDGVLQSSFSAECHYTPRAVRDQEISGKETATIELFFDIGDQAVPHKPRTHS